MSKEIKSTLPATPNYYVTSTGGGDNVVLRKYMEEVQKYPNLTAEEEYDYAIKWRDNHDEKAAEQLVKSHLKFVVSIAYKMTNYGLPMDELISYGNMGLMVAAKQFDPDKGARFSTYSEYWIRSEMFEYILNNFSLSKIGSSAGKKTVFFNLSRAKRALGITDTNLSDEQIKQLAHHLAVTESDVKEISLRLSARDVSLNATVNSDSDSTDMLSNLEDKSSTPIQETLEEHEFTTKASALLHKHLASLPERDREIFTARRLSEPALTLEALSQKYGISRERVRQIEERTYNKIREAILKDPENKISE